MSIEKRLERLEAIVDARGLDWDHPRVEDEPSPVDFGDKDHPVVMRQTMVFSLSQSDKNQPSKEPPKKWRILEPGEVVQEGDWVNAKSNLPSDPPNGLGWKPAISAGLTVLKLDGCVFARPVFDDPAKQPEPEHPPDPGEGYRILSKDPPEDLSPGDEYFGMWDGLWRESRDALEGIREQRETRWYRRKIETPKDEYREPVLPADACKECQFSDDGIEWRSGWLNGWVQRSHQWISHSGGHWRHCRIKKDA